MGKVIFFDFDGVILDSMKVRDLGFRTIFNKYPKKSIEELIHYHNTNGGLSRFHKIKYFYENILNLRITDEQINQYAFKFSEIMKMELIKKEYLITETVNFIKRNHSVYTFHIVSGSEQTELQYLCKSLNISQYFKTIEGSPTKKDILVKHILEKEKYVLEKCTLIGDSINDYDAAMQNNISFYGYNNPKLKDISNNYITNFSVFKW